MTVKQAFFSALTDDKYVLSFQQSDGDTLHRFEVSKHQLSLILMDATHSIFGASKTRGWDLAGHTFGMLTVLKEIPKGGKYRGQYRNWLCQCSCGNEVVRRSGSFNGTSNPSCGCILLVDNKRRFAKKPTKKLSPEWISWKSMRLRCLNPNHHSYYNYGGRGILICERWSKFANFSADMGLKPSPRHTLDRVNNDGNYEPANCRWATPSQQMNNRRISKNRVPSITTEENANGDSRRQQPA